MFLPCLVSNIPLFFSPSSSTFLFMATSATFFSPLAVAIFYPWDGLSLTISIFSFSPPHSSFNSVPFFSVTVISLFGSTTLFWPPAVRVCVWWVRVSGCVPSCSWFKAGDEGGQKIITLAVSPSPPPTPPTRPLPLLANAWDRSLPYQYFRLTLTLGHGSEQESKTGNIKRLL